MRFTACLAALAFIGGFFLVSCAQKPAPTPQASAPAAFNWASFDWDKGPTNIDKEAAKYPKEMQATYHNIIKTQCSACHPLARVLWAPYYDQALWTKIVNKMATRPGTVVNPKDSNKIVAFLVYDHQRRRGEIEKAFTANHWQKKEPLLP